MDQRSIPFCAWTSTALNPLTTILATPKETRSLSTLLIFCENKLDLPDWPPDAAATNLSSFSRTPEDWKPSWLPSEYGKRLYYDTCAFGEAALMFAIQAVGVGQMLFGTDDPFIGSDTSHVKRLPISDADKAAIFGGNAARMFGLKSA